MKSNNSFIIVGINLIKRNVIFTILIISVFLLNVFCIVPINTKFNSLSASSQTVAKTDTTRDIIKYVTNATINTTLVYTNQTMDNIDITSMSYGNDSSGNFTITLDLVGSPTINNQTFYLIKFDGGNDNETYLAYVGNDGTGSDYQKDNLSYSILFYKGGYAFFNSTIKTSTNSIIWVFPKQISSLNITPQPYWYWQAYSCYGVSGCNPKTGTYWWDSMPNLSISGNSTTSTNSSSISTTTTPSSSSTSTTSITSTIITTNSTAQTNKSLNTNNSSNSNTSQLTKTAAGFDIFPVFMMLIFGTIIALIERKRKK